MTLSLILLLFTILSIVHLLYNSHVITVTQRAIYFLTEAQKIFLTRTEYALEANNAGADWLTLVKYINALLPYTLIIVLVIILNATGFAFAFNNINTPGTTILLYVIALGDSLILVNSYIMWKRKWQINALCLGYNISLQSIQYIDSELKENQKEG